MSQTDNITNNFVTAAVAEAALSDTAYTPPTIEKPPVVLTPMPPPKKRAPKHDFKDGRGRVFAHRHDNGGGWVEDGARVAPDVYVGPTAQVMNRATIFGSGIRIESKAVVKGSATITNNTRLSGFAIVGGTASVRESLLSGTCSVTGGAEVAHCTMEHAVVIGGSAHVKGSRLSGRILINDNAVVIGTHARGFVQFMGNCVSVRSSVEGLAEFRDHAQLLRAYISCMQWSVNYLSGPEYANRRVRPEFFVTLSGNATVQNDSNINAPMELTGRALIDNCKINFEYPGQRGGAALFILPDPDGNYPDSTPVFTRKRVHDKKWCNTNVHNHGEFERLVNDESTGTGQLRSVRAAELQSPYSLENLSGGRRIVPV